MFAAKLFDASLENSSSIVSVRQVFEKPGSRWDRENRRNEKKNSEQTKKHIDNELSVLHFRARNQIEFRFAIFLSVKLVFSRTIVLLDRIHKEQRKKEFLRRANFDWNKGEPFRSSKENVPRRFFASAFPCRPSQNYRICFRVRRRSTKKLGFSFSSFLHSSDLT